MPFKPDDIVRVIAVEPGAMISSYLGAEGRVLSKHPELPLYEIELDAGRATPDRGGQLGPRFIVKENCLDPDVTKQMIAAVRKLVDNALGDAMIVGIYRAMREARFKR